MSFLKQFRYRARSQGGELREGMLEADGLGEAARILKEQGLFTVQLAEAKREHRFMASLSEQGNAKYAALFCRQLSIMLDEQPLNAILGMLAKQKGDRKYQQMLQDMQQEVEMGKSLSLAMEKHKDIFSPTVIHLVEAGQESGNLTEILTRLADFLEKEYATRQKLGSAMLYPALLGVVSLCSMLFLIVFILPTFAMLFENFHTELPLPTRMLLGIGAFTEAYGQWIPLVIFLLLAGGYWGYRQRQEMADYLLLRLPVLGQLKQQIAWMHVLGTLAVQIDSGMRIDTALGMVCEVPSNQYLRQFLQKLRDSVSHGYPLVRLLETCPVFPPMLLELIAAGESTGRLPEMLQKSADYCAISAENLSSRLHAMMEPALLLALGGIVFTFILSVVLPLLETMDQFG